MTERSRTFALAAGLGLVAGMRSMSAPALLSHHLSQRRGHGSGAAVRLLGSPRTARVLGLLAAAEIAADKTPFVPDRTEPPSLVGRALSGALCGTAVAGWRGGSQVGAALVGAAAALGSTFLAYHLRREARQASGVPDAVLALVEDAVVLTAGSHLAAATE